MTHPFSPTYIAMAAASAEIQAQRPRIVIENGREEAVGRSALGSCFTYPNIDMRGEIELLHRDNDTGRMMIGSYGQENVEWVWLPLLHQILGMLAGDPHDFLKIVLDDDWEKIQPARKQEYFIDDWHELALAVFMREKFGKRWDSQEGKWTKA